VAGPVAQAPALGINQTLFEHDFESMGHDMTLMVDGSFFASFFWGRPKKNYWKNIRVMSL
jgi:hypothetical protein